MSNKTVGVIFIALATFLLGVLYTSAAITIGGRELWSSDLFTLAVESAGPVLPIAAGVLLIAGICFLVSGLLQKKNNQE